MARKRRSIETKISVVGVSIKQVNTNQEIYMKMFASTALSLTLIAARAFAATHSNAMVEAMIKMCPQASSAPIK